MELFNLLANVEKGVCMSHEHRYPLNSRYDPLSAASARELQIYWEHLITQRCEVDDAVLGPSDIALIYTPIGEDSHG
jgi:hypothetical protein